MKDLDRTNRGRRETTIQQDDGDVDLPAGIMIWPARAVVPSWLRSSYNPNVDRPDRG
jgi:hypothetical protein